MNSMKGSILGAYKKVGGVHAFWDHSSRAVVEAAGVTKVVRPELVRSIYAYQAVSLCRVFPRGSKTHIFGFLSPKTIYIYIYICISYRGFWAILGLIGFSNHICRSELLFVVGYVTSWAWLPGLLRILT